MSAVFFGVDFGEADVGVGIDAHLLVYPPNTLGGADLVSVLSQKKTGVRQQFSALPTENC